MVLIITIKIYIFEAWEQQSKAKVSSMSAYIELQKDAQLVFLECT
jgi:hypothetical protein